MGQPLRITLNNADYTFTIVKGTPVGRMYPELQIMLNGHILTMIKSGMDWLLKEDQIEDQSLIKAVGKAISLRYRI